MWYSLLMMLAGGLLIGAGIRGLATDATIKDLTQQLQVCTASKL